MTVGDGDVGRTGVGHRGSTRERIVDSERDRVGTTDIARRIDELSGIERSRSDGIAVAKVERSEANPTGICSDSKRICLSRVDRTRGSSDRTRWCFVVTTRVTTTV